MKIVPTMRWILLYSLLATGGVGGGAYWFFTRSDELLKAEVLKQLATMFPDAEFDLDRANFDLSGRVRATRVRMNLPGEDFSALTISELVIALDRDQLAETQAIQIQRIRLIKPRIWAIRDSEGSWNWQRLSMRKTEGGVLPDVELEHGTLTVQFELPPQTPLDFNITELRLTADPSSDRSWAVNCSGRIDGSEPVSVRGDFHVDGAPWKVAADAEGWIIDQPLIGKVLTVYPEFQRQLVTAETRLAELTNSRGASQNAPIRIMNVSQNGAVDLGIQLLTDVQVRVSRRTAEQPIDFQVSADVRNGRITNPILPLPLRELSGEFYADRQRVVLKEIQGRYGETTVACSGKWTQDESPTMTLQARHVVVDEALAARLPGSLSRLIQSLSLRGNCNIDASITKTELGVVPKVDLTLTDGSILHEKFRYPIRDVSATLNWHGELAMLKGQGQAGLAPVEFNGTINRPGPGAEMVIMLNAQQVPIDETLLNACPESVRDVMKALDLHGQGDAWVKLVKPAGIGTKITPQITARMRNCSVNYGKFPLRIERVSGLVVWDGEAATFKDLRGRHADAEITAHGSYARSPRPGKLELEFQLTDVPFDAELLAALPERLQETWHEFQPQGKFDGIARVNWSPGGELELSLPRVKVQDARITLRHFPFPWQGVAAELEYARDRLILHSLTAVHDDCRIRGKGEGVFPADQPWQFRFAEFFVDDLPLSPALRRALPEGLRTIVETLNPTGTISLQSPMTFFGPNTRRESVGIDFKTTVLLSGSSLNVGQRLDNVHGRATLHGTWDGTNAAIHHGNVDLDSLEVLEHHLTQVRGPFRYENGRLTAGSAQAVAGPVLQVQNDIPWTDQISAKAIDGTLTLNSIVDFELEPQYRLRILLIGGNLERYAQTYFPEQRNIRGTMNGWLDLQGAGDRTDDMSGSGQLTIRPAELYELPVFLQLFQTLGLQPQERTAFREASFRFNVNRGRFNFDQIRLDGNAVSLAGRGYVRFDGIVALEFFSQMGRNRIRVPIVSDVIGMLGTGWYGFTVSGHINDPAVEMRAIPELDDALQNFLGVFEPRLPAPPNRRVIPRTGQPAGPERR